MTGPRLSVSLESWPIAGAFAISRGAKRNAEVVVATFTGATAQARGECVPYSRYDETVAGVRDAILSMSDAVSRGLTRQELQGLMPPGAARNALDCAFWDYEAKSTGTTAAVLAGLDPLRPLTTAFTVGLDSPSAMAEKARAAARHPLLKLKLAGDGDAERLRAVREARPDARLIVDANEGWRGPQLEPLLVACARVGVELVEQPLPAGEDDALAHLDHAVPICADESLHTAGDLDALAGRYDAVNIKLDKTGGLTEALALRRQAKARGFAVMVGCMVSTSLAMAPALLVAQDADFVDLDGPLLLARDREPGLVYDGATIAGGNPDLWG